MIYIIVRTSFMLLGEVVVHDFSLLYSILLYKYTTIYLFSPLLFTIWGYFDELSFKLY